MSTQPSGPFVAVPRPNTLTARTILRSDKRMQDVLSAFDAHQRFLITTHISPDGDAIGSQVALGHFLRKLGKDVAMINSDAMPYNLTWLPGAKDVEVFDKSIAQRERIDAAEVVIVSDTNAAHRLGKMQGAVEANRGLKLLIDHHTHPEDWFDVEYRRDTASSAGELMFELMEGYDADLIDETIATALYTAIMTDTGSFRFSSVNPRVHRIIADLLERGGIEPAPIHAELYDNRTLSSLRLLGMALDTVDVRYGGKVAIMLLNNDMLQAADASNDDTGGLVNYVLSIEGVEAGLLFKEISKGTKVSFRSQIGTHVNDWARAFGGGGHRNAAGAFIEKPLHEAVDMVMRAAPRFLDVEEEDESLSEDDAAALAQMMKEGGSRRVRR